MRSAGHIFSPAHRNTAGFGELITVRGPFVSLYLDTAPDVEQAPKMVEARWKTTRRDLAEQGAPEHVLAAIDPHIVDAHTRGATLAVIANADGAQRVAHHEAEPKRDLALWAALPRLAPMLEWRQKSVPHVVVATDRTGADISAVRENGVDVSFTVDAKTADEVHKTQPGGWSQPRYQRRVENAWDQSAGEVAAAVESAADDVDAAVIVVAGDVRAVELLTKHLPPRLSERVHTVPGGRHANGSDGAVATEVSRLVATSAAAATVEILQKFREERGQADRAADGPAATIGALARAQVETLLVADTAAADQQAWFGPSPEQVGLDRATVEAMGVETPEAGRLVDTAIRAAIGTGAGVWIVPGAGGPTDGIGAILRWA